MTEAQGSTISVMSLMLTLSYVALKTAVRCTYQCSTQESQSLKRKDKKSTFPLVEGPGPLILPSDRTLPKHLESVKSSCYTEACNKNTIKY